MTPDQKALLDDKLDLWERLGHEGELELRDYYRRSADALRALLSAPPREEEGDAEALNRYRAVMDGCTTEVDFECEAESLEEALTDALTMIVEGAPSPSNHPVGVTEMVVGRELREAAQVLVDYADRYESALAKANPGYAGAADDNDIIVELGELRTLRKALAAFSSPTPPKDADGAARGAFDGPKVADRLENVLRWLREPGDPSGRARIADYLEGNIKQLRFGDPQLSAPPQPPPDRVREALKAAEAIAAQARDRVRPDDPQNDRVGIRVRDLRTLMTALSALEAAG